MRAKDLENINDRLTLITEANRMSTLIRNYRYRLVADAEKRERELMFEEVDDMAFKHKRELAEIRCVIKSLEETIAIKRSARRAYARKTAVSNYQLDSQLVDMANQRDRLLEHIKDLTRARTALLAVYRLEREDIERQVDAAEANYSALEGSLAFATAEHRTHMDHCRRLRAENEEHLEQLSLKLTTERSARMGLQDEYRRLQRQHTATVENFVDLKKKIEATQCKIDFENVHYRAMAGKYRAAQQASAAIADVLAAKRNELRARLSIVSEGYSITEKKLLQSERQLYVESRQHRHALAAHQAGQKVSDIIIDTLIEQAAPAHQIDRPLSSCDTRADDLEEERSGFLSGISPRVSGVEKQ
jgi:hypothetical protein